MQANRIIGALRNKNLMESNTGSITVSTAHGFQGDEREIMIFSIVIGPEMSDRTIMWVHALDTNSKNLLNVAITRARRGLHIIGNRKMCVEAGGLLKELMCYIDRIK